MTDEVLDEFAAACRAAMHKKFNRGRSEDFSLYMSNVGRPLCQLQLEKAGVPKETPPYNLTMKFLIGDMVEAAAMAILKSAGVNVKASSEKTSLQIKDGDLTTEVRGKSDVRIEEDGQDGIYDLKTASNYAFHNKFRKGYKAVKEEDAFGYIGQGYGYGEGMSLPFKGWIVINKETGEICVTEAPDNPDEKIEALSHIRGNVTALNAKHPFRRCFTDEEETHRNKPTGNRKLGTTCSFCDFKRTCWPGLQYKPSPASEAKNPRWAYYTFIDPKYEKTNDYPSTGN